MNSPALKSKRRDDQAPRRQKNGDNKKTEFISLIQEVEKLVSLGTMAAGLSHELRNPLVSIKTLSSLLRKDPSSLKLDENFSATVQRDVKRVISIVEGVSAFARNTDGSFKPVYLHDILEESLVIAEPHLKQSKIDVSYDANLDLPCLLGDRDQLVQIFRNLLENATNAIDEWDERIEPGRITVSTYQRSARDTEDVLHWLITDVKDNGPGIPKDFQRSIFDPFVTSRDTGLRSGSRGTGLGLAIVSKIIERHGGIVSVSSELSRGAVFTVSLPIRK